LKALEDDDIPVGILVVFRQGEAPAGLNAVCDSKGLIAERYDARDGSAYLIRPDQHIAARFRSAQIDKVRAAVQRATAQL